MLRRISTKLVLAVLAAVVLPFLGFAWFMDRQMAEKLSRQVVEQSLKGVAAELSGQVDALVEGCNQDVALWAAEWTCYMAVTESGGVGPAPDATLAIAELEQADVPPWGADAFLARARGETASVPDATFRPIEVDTFDGYVSRRQIFDLLLLVDDHGRLQAMNSRDPGGELVGEAAVRALFERDFSAEPWFGEALAGAVVRAGPSASDLLPRSADAGAARAPRPDELHVAFAAPVPDYGVPGERAGVLLALVNWRHVADLVRPEAVVDYFRGLVGPEDYPSAYAWIWEQLPDDCRVLAHKDASLFGQRISGDLHLPQMVADVQASEWALHSRYSFPAKRRAAFKHGRSPAEGGLSWVVGVGIDEDDIYAQARELRALLYKSTAVVLLVVLLWTLVIARRTTAPIHVLREHTARVAGGDFSATVDIRSTDELGELAAAFNKMTHDLAEKTERLVKAEKDAAWREMARQIAHDIKNPLTPIKLSLDLLERARAEQSPNREQILERTMQMMQRQVDHLREIANDFYEFTGGRKPVLEPIDAGALLGEVLQLHAAWAEERRVSVRSSGAARVLADRGKLRRVLVNLVSNALEAMRADGGELTAEIRAEGGRAAIEIADRGPGLSETARRHLFEPYFTTRTEGTGLGLAISKRAVEEMGGTIELATRPDGRGTIARVVLPLASA